jgi:hypothetical protein
MQIQHQFITALSHVLWIGGLPVRERPRSLIGSHRATACTSTTLTVRKGSTLHVGSPREILPWRRFSHRVWTNDG